MLTHVAAIFKRELSSYFDSPLAYIVIPVFLALVGGFSLYFQDLLGGGACGETHGWARGMGQHCELAPSELHCQPYRSCSGARWRMCESRYPGPWPRGTNCSDAMVDLKTALGWRGNATARTKKG